MKLVLEIISGAIIGIVGTILIWLLNIEMTAVQSGVLIGGLILTTILMQEVVNAILSKRESKKRND
ncbi:MAG: hypothetical protein FWD84_01585 [Oscillospiraceae bacterium]|nr:hypothetical protein [Oscillospiraceae bacterium]